MEEVREQMGSGPVYISFDIDALDPSFAPGTGTCSTPAAADWFSFTVICRYAFLINSVFISTLS